MANTKQITIHGQVPFNLHEHEGLAKKLAFMNSPTAGIRINYVGPTEHRKNNHGGKTAFYAFQLEGTEAVHTKWLQAFVDQVKEIGGNVSLARIYDIDGSEEVKLNL
jgi:hypothetical protein